jgi:ketosteroid isomerase-like protein
MSEQENTGVVQRAYENFKTGNIEALLNQLSDDAEWRLADIENVPFGGKRRGRAQIAEFFSILADSQETRSFEPREFVAQGEKVVALGSYEWRVRRTGRVYGGEWAHVFTVRDGKIVGFHEYMDTAAAVAAYK